MNSPDPVKSPTSLAPSGSTYGSGAGAALAIVFIVICDKYGIDFPAGFEGALASLFTVLGGYLPKSGRKQ